MKCKNKEVHTEDYKMEQSVIKDIIKTSPTFMNVKHGMNQMQQFWTSKENSDKSKRLKEETFNLQYSETNTNDL